MQTQSLTLIVREGSLPNISMLSLQIPSHDPAALDKFLEIMEEQLAARNLFWWNSLSEQWEKAIFSRPFAERILKQGEFYFWRDMPMLVPRPDFVETAIQSATQFGKTAQAFVTNYIQSSQEALDNFINNINCVAVPSAPLDEEGDQPKVDVKRNDPEWENRWLEWTDRQHSHSSSERLVSSEIAAALPSILPDPDDLSQSAMDEKLAHVIASEQNAPAEPIAIREDQFNLGQIRSSLTPLQQNHLDTLQGMGFETKILLSAANFFLKNPDLHNFHELLDHIFEL